MKGLKSSPDQIKESIKGFEEIGADEVMLWPTIAEIGQLDQLVSVLSPDYLHLSKQHESQKLKLLLQEKW